ncbi:hypothetical protein [Streptomyces sp. NPDC001985]|uniref:hypothetical protein n=1 Tax=Streptomyces sp. NPDC001985 TaxID=3154406 RepID=UPI00331E3C23
MAVIKNKENEEIVIVPSQMRPIIPRLDDIARRVRAIGADIEFVGSTPLEGDPANETYQAVMEVLGKAPEVVEGYAAVAEGITNIGKVVEGMAKAGELAESTGQEVVIGLSNRLPESPPPAPGGAAPGTGTGTGGRRS